MTQLLFLSEAGGGELPAAPTIPSSDMWQGIKAAIDGFLPLVTDVFDFVVSNPLCLTFLGISFIGIGIRYMVKITRAFGRG